MNQNSIPARSILSLPLAAKGALAALGAIGAIAGLVAGTTAPAVAQSRVSIGLAAKGARVLLEEGAGPQSPALGDRFGSALAVGDFNADGFADLAIGVPRNDRLPAMPDAGAVEVRFGSATGALDVLLPLVPWDNANDPAETNDQYGYALAAGDFNGDGHDDLAVGIPDNDYFDGTSVDSMGGVQLHFGMENGDGRLQPIAQYSFSQVAGGGLPGAGFDDEGFGSALAFGDFNGDGKDDLAVGIPFDVRACPTGSCYAGAVMVIDLDDNGAVGGYLMALGLEGLPGQAAENDHFGRAVEAGDWNGDGFEDLAIGIPGRATGSGAVLVVYGSPFSLLFGNHQLLTQGEFGELPEIGDQFGAALASGDFNDDGIDDLAMAAPTEDGLGPDTSDSGQVIVSYGTALGLSTVAAPWLSEDGIFFGGAEAGDVFGSALAAADFDGDGIDDLAVGVGGDNGPAGVRGGAAVVIRGRAASLAGSPARKLRPGDFPVGLIAGRPGEADAWAMYGTALAAGDFDGNGSADLAIGAPNRPLSSSENVGAVAITYGQLFVDGFESQDGLEWTAVAP